MGAGAAERRYPTSKVRETPVRQYDLGEGIRGQMTEISVTEKQPIPWSTKWKPTPVFLPGKFHEQRRLVDCSPWSCKESGRTEHACMYRYESWTIKKAECQRIDALNCGVGEDS